MPARRARSGDRRVPDVRVNGRPALRVGDPGIQATCCGTNRWQALTGSSNVFINGLAAHRVRDHTRHCGADGELIEGSDNVLVGGGRNPGQQAKAQGRKVWYGTDTNYGPNLSPIALPNPEVF